MNITIKVSIIQQQPIKSQQVPRYQVVRFCDSYLILLSQNLTQLTHIPGEKNLKEKTEAMNFFMSNIQPKNNGVYEYILSYAGKRKHVKNRVLRISQQTKICLPVSQYYSKTGRQEDKRPIVYRGSTLVLQQTTIRIQKMSTKIA